MASTTHVGSGQGEQFETLSETTEKKRFWSRGGAAVEVKHCLYCGEDSTDQELAAFSANVLNSTQPITDVCPHCTKLDGFRQQQEWILTSTGKYLYRQAKSRFSSLPA